MFFEIYISDEKTYVTRKKINELLSNISHNSDNDNFIQHQLQLFEALCMNRNQACIDLLIEAGHISWDTSFSVIKDDTIDPKIRSLFCMIVTSKPETHK